MKAPRGSASLRVIGLLQARPMSARQAPRRAMASSARQTCIVGLVLALVIRGPTHANEQSLLWLGCVRRHPSRLFYACGRGVTAMAPHGAAGPASLPAALPRCCGIHCRPLALRRLAWPSRARLRPPGPFVAGLANPKAWPGVVVGAAVRS